VILGDSSAPKLDDVRHAYLHSSSKPRHNQRCEFKGVKRLLALVAKAQGVEPSYARIFTPCATESLIRAIELRMDRTPAVRGRETVDSYYPDRTAAGPVFFRALARSKGRSPSRTLRRQARGFNETAAAASRTRSTRSPSQKTSARPEIPQAPPTPPPNPTRDL